MARVAAIISHSYFSSPSSIVFVYSLFFQFFYVLDVSDDP